MTAVGPKRQRLRGLNSNHKDRTNGKLPAAVSAVLVAFQNARIIARGQLLNPSRSSHTTSWRTSSPLGQIVADDDQLNAFVLTPNATDILPCTDKTPLAFQVSWSSSQTLPGHMTKVVYQLALFIKKTQVEKRRGDLLAFIGIKEITPRSHSTLI